jgi:hypothetical protein
MSGEANTVNRGAKVAEMTNRILTATALVGAIVAVVLVVATLPESRASAQVPPRPPRGASEVAQESACGAQINAVMKNETIAQTAMVGDAFTPIRRATVNLPVTAGEESCIVVTLTGNAAVVDGPGTVDRCYVRALAGGSPISPVSNVRELVSERQPVDDIDASAAVWSQRLTPASNSLEVRIEWRGPGNDVRCTFGPWHMTVQQFD